MLARAADGDALAISQLWHENHHRLLRYLRAHVAGAADDVAQQVWLEIARNLPTFRGDITDLRRWLFATARRRVLDEIAKPRRIVHIGGERPATPVEPELVVGPNADLDWALTLVGLLPPEQTDVVALRVIAGLDVEDIAFVMDRRESAVRAMLHRAMSRLEQLLRNESESGETPGNTTAMSHP